MGGSSLAPEVFWKTFGPREGYLRLHVLDSTHPDQVQAVIDAIDLETTLFIVSSKSGGTIETLSQFKLFHARQPDGAHFVAVTDPGSGLAELALRERLPAALRRRPGDRRALQRAVSMFGLVPAALIGRRPRARVLDGARRRRVDPERGQRACGSAARSASWRRPGRDKLTFVVDDPLASLRPLGRAADRGVHRQAGPRHPARRRRAARAPRRPTAPTASSCTSRSATGRRDALAGAARRRPPGASRSTPRGAERPRPACSCSAELATAVAGWVLEINPFDQPNVQEAKDNTNAGARRGPARARATGDLDALHERARAAAATWRSWPTSPYSEDVDAQIAEAARAPDRRDARRRDHLRLRPALPALHRTAAQGRPEDRPVPADLSTPPERGPRDPGRAVHASTP